MEELRLSQARAHTLMAVLALGLLTTLVPAAQASDESDQRAVNKAHGFLRTEKRGKEILSYIHMGASYQGHQYMRTVPVKNRMGDLIEGDFALVYRYKWEDDGVTDAAFLCGANEMFMLCGS